MNMGKIIWENYARLDSTQTLAHKKINEMVYEKPLLIIAEEQLSGFGRQGNKWESPKGNLYTTFSFIPKKKIEYVEVSLQIMQRVVKRLTGQTIVLINNDMRYNNKKCGGMMGIWQKDLEDKEILCLGIGFNCVEAVSTTQPTSFIKCDAKELIFAWIHEAEDILF